MSEIPEEVQDKPVLSTDKALDNYLEESMEKLEKIIDLLVKAEEAYAMSKGVNREDKDWKKRRDGFRAEGTDYLNRAKVLFLC